MLRLLFIPPPFISGKLAWYLLSALVGAVFEVINIPPFVLMFA
jgi:hypothetical protein